MPYEEPNIDDMRYALQVPELRETPRNLVQRGAGWVGRKVQSTGRVLGEALNELEQTHPVRSWLAKNLITEPVQNIGAAMQDWSGTPRDITPERPYHSAPFYGGSSATLNPQTWGPALQTFRTDPRLVDAATAAQPVAGSARKAAAPLARGAGEVLNARMLSGQSLIPGLPPSVAPNPLAFVVKPTKGGNWLTGSIEDETSVLKRRVASPAELEGLRTRQGEQVFAEMNRNQAPDVALNNWIDTKLNRYIRNEMATPEDPLRAMAESGTLHFRPTAVRGDQAYDLDTLRKYSGAQESGLAKSRLARSWEDRSDLAMNYQGSHTFSPQTVSYKENPWLEKLPTGTQVYSLGSIDELGFSHLTDELRNALNPASGLPRNLQLTPEQLSKVTVPQAVERVAKINAWRAAQKAEADAARASNAATVTHREYQTIPGTDTPNERGLRWVELKTPEKSEKQNFSKFTKSDMDEIRRAAETETWGLKESGDPRPIEDIYDEVHANIMREHKPSYSYESSKELEDALKYEGETMGHCVGGYCPDVAAGRTRIYSLRDAKGQPHVTIEVQPNKMTPGQFIHSEDVPQSLLDRLREAERSGKPFDWEKMVIESPEYQNKDTKRIVQIKGKGNRKPNAEYMPFVQDFVRSGQWSDVGDLKNADMFKLPDNRFVTRQRFEEAIRKLGGAGDKPIEPEWLSEQIGRDPSWWENVKPAFEEPAPVRQHKMLQGIYRGYAGENDVNNALTGNYVAYGTPQRRVAEHYAQTRAAATGQPPHMEMLMIDPFDVKRSYGHAPAVRADQEPMVTQAKQLLPTQIKGRTQLYKKGGAVTLDDMRYALTMRK